MTLALPHNEILQKRLALTLMCSCVSLFALYIYFLSASVMHVVIRTEATHGTADIRSEIGSLESKYIAAQHEVSQTIATLDGYTTIDKKIFIDRTTPSLVLNTTRKQQ